MKYFSRNRMTYNELRITQLNICRSIQFGRNNLNAHRLIDATEMTTRFDDPFIVWAFDGLIVMFASIRFYRV